MTVVSNDPSLWPTISSNISISYWTVAAGVMVLYDWVLTVGQEIELIWRQRWSLMTVLYLAIRYIGPPYSVISFLQSAPYVSLTDAECNIMFSSKNGTYVVVITMLCIIMIARLYAMYQSSRTMLIVLVIIFLAVNIAGAVITAIGLKDTVAEELILSGTYICNNQYTGDVQLLFSMVWTLELIWEVLALCLSIWIAVKHFRTNRRQLGPSAGSTIEECFIVLLKSHVLYFASFVGASCLQLGLLSSELSNLDSIGVRIFYGAGPILFRVQMFVLGPRLILNIREYHAKLVGDSYTDTSMHSIVFQERVHVPTSSIV